jgi:hypothetical protein
VISFHPLPYCRSDHTGPLMMTASGPGGLRKKSPVLTSAILGPSPGLDARTRFEAAAQGGGISPLGPLTKPTHPQLDPRSMPLSRGRGARPAAYERGRRTHPRAQPWTASLSKASKLLAKVATLQGYQYWICRAAGPALRALSSASSFELRASQPDRLEPSNSSKAAYE